MALWGSLGGRDLLDPEKLATSLRGGDPPLPVDWAGLPNRFACPVGLAPGRGHVLLLQSDLDALDLKGRLALKLGESGGGTRVTFPNLRAVGHPRCLDWGVPDPAYLVEIADCRVDLVGATPARFNWRYNPTDDDAESDTTTYTSWSALAEYLWGLLPTLGDWPGLPADVPTPTAAVLDRLDLHAFPVRDALEDALCALGCAAAYDPIKDTFSVVYFPTAKDKAPDVRKKFHLIYDERPYCPKDWGPVPGQVGVLFPAWLPGRNDREPRLTYAKPVTRPAVSFGADASRGTSSQFAYLQDYTVARVTAYGSIVNSSLLAGRASQVARIYFDRFKDGAARKPVRQAFSGLIDDPDVRPGGTYDLVSWGCTTEGPVTAVARAGMSGTVELYAGDPADGLVNDAGLGTDAIESDDDDIPARAGGPIPTPDRERDAAGFESDRRWVSIAGAGAGPLYRRSSALRLGDWTSVGSGGHTDQRARLWRNWEDWGPDDMVRLIHVTGDLTGVLVNGVSVDLYPASPVKQAGAPADWGLEEDCYLAAPNGETLTLDREYLARAGTRADDLKHIWATFCCSGGSGVTRTGGPGGNDRPPLGGRRTVTPCAAYTRKWPEQILVTFADSGAVAANTCGYSADWAAMLGSAVATWSPTGIAGGGYHFVAEAGDLASIGLVTCLYVKIDGYVHCCGGGSPLYFSGTVSHLSHPGNSLIIGCSEAYCDHTINPIPTAACDGAMGNEEIVDALVVDPLYTRIRLTTVPIDLIVTELS